MNTKELLLAEIRQEAAATKKMLEKVPMDQADYRAHPKSMALGKLAIHVASLGSWIKTILTTDEFDFAKRTYNPATATNTEELLAVQKRDLDSVIEVIEATPEEEFGKPWTLRHGDHVIFTQPKVAALRSFSLSHSYHHRGQLSVYLRLLDVPVPGMYGPSADEAMPRPAQEKKESQPA